MILVETYAVLARNVLLIPTPWVDELLKLLFVWSIFVCSALAFLSDDLISLTLLEDGAREQGKEKKYGVFKLIQYVVALVISGLIVLQLLTIVSTHRRGYHGAQVSAVGAQYRRAAGHGPDRCFCHPQASGLRTAFFREKDRPVRQRRITISLDLI